MHRYNYNEEGHNVRDIVLHYESMLLEGSIGFLDTEAFLHLIDYYEENNQLNKALEVISYALDQHQYSATFHLRKAQLLIEQDQLEQATTALEKAKIFEPTNTDILLTEVDLLQHNERYNQALDLIESIYIAADSSDYQEISVVKANVLEAKGDYTAAFDAWWEVLWAEPQSDLAASRLWMCTELTQDYPKAIQKHKELLDKDPYAYWAWYNLGYAYSKIEAYEKAIEAYDYAIVVNEEFEFAYRDCVDCLCEIEDYQGALQYLEDYREHFELDATVFYLFGNCYEGMGDYAKARTYYAKAAQQESLDGLVYFRMGLCYVKQGCWKLACATLEKAHTLDKENLDFVLALAQVHQELENTEEVHNFYHKALELQIDLPSIWLGYIRFLIEQGAYLVAAELVEEARKYTTSLQIDYAEAAIYLSAGNRQEGLILLMQALVEDREDYKCLFVVAPELEDDEDIIDLIANT
ncbi:MAG: tetratricopeptide repeat protein [Saprospiraceae bacterium]|nr:tetratricopeptide repeat protein [Saprospiraceae bacterium]